MEPKPQFDYKLATQKIKEATSFQEIQQVAAFISTATNLNELDLAKRFEFYLVDNQNVYPLELKVNIFETMAALILSDQKQRFFKHIVARIELFLKKYSSKVSMTWELSKRVVEVFKRWQTAATFSKNYYMRLRGTADSIYTSNRKELAPVFKKYPKEFLQTYRRMMQIDLSNALYQSLQMKTAGLEQLNVIKAQYGDWKKQDQSTQESKTKACLLRNRVYQLTEKLMTSLKFNKKGAQILQSFMQQQTIGIEMSDKEEPTNWLA